MSSHFLSMIDVGSDLADLVRDLREWSEATFGPDGEFGPRVPLLCLKAEVKQAGKALDAFHRAEASENMAACFLFLIDASRRNGVKPLELIRAAQKKLDEFKKVGLPAHLLDAAAWSPEEDA